MSDVRWEGFTHEEIHERVMRGPGRTASADAEAAWTTVASTIHAVDDQLTRAVRQIAVEWEGAAADRVRGGVTELSNWALDAANDALQTRQAIADQAGFATELRAKMPPPHEVDLPVITGKAAGLGTAVSAGQLEDRKTEDRTVAVELMNRYTSDSGTSQRLMSFWTQPPSVVVEAAAAGPGLGAGAAGIVGAPGAAGTLAGGPGSGPVGVPGAPPFPAAGAGAGLDLGPGPVVAGAGTGTTGGSTTGRTPAAGPPGGVLPGPTGRSGPTPRPGLLPGTDPRTGGVRPVVPGPPARPSGPGAGVLGPPGPPQRPGGAGTGGSGLLGPPASARLGGPAPGVGPEAPVRTGGGLGIGPGAPNGAVPRSVGGAPEAWSAAGSGRGAPSAGHGFLPLGAGMAQSAGQEHRRAPYLVDDTDAFADDRWFTPPVIGGDDPEVGCA